MRATASSRRSRHAEYAYLLDRHLKDAASAHDFAGAALDAVRLALRPAYAALSCRSASGLFHCGDKPLSADVDAISEILALAPRSLLARPVAIRRSEAAAWGQASLESAMKAAALEVVVPLASDGALVGVLAVGPRSDRRPLTDDDVEFCQRLGARLSTVAAREVLAAEVEALRSAGAVSERLASVGRMAAGLAHEIRNPLVSIRTFTQLLPERHADEEFRNEFLHLTLAEIDRISALVGEILSYARPAVSAGHDDSPAATDVGDCLERTCLLLRSHARGSGVALEFEAAELYERAAIDEDRLRQVVINLVVNAIQACGGRGRVSVRVAPSSFGQPIAIEIRDDGPGMSAEVAAKVFEPFFTTRREGTGLGLALVRRILDEAGGTIALETAPGSGAAFRIVLPTESAAAAALAAVDAPSPTAELPAEAAPAPRRARAASAGRRRRVRAEASALQETAS